MKVVLTVVVSPSKRFTFDGEVVVPQGMSLLDTAVALGQAEQALNRLTTLRVHIDAADGQPEAPAAEGG